MERLPLRLEKRFKFFPVLAWNFGWVRRVGPMREKALKRKLDVTLRDDLVGRLWLDERRRFVFQ